MPDQLTLFAGADEPAPALPEGFRYQAELISAHDERALLAHVQTLPFREFEFHGYTGKRRTVSFGWRYDFDSEELRRTDPVPAFLLPLREAAASFAGLAPSALEQVLLTEYQPGAAIGWHRDKAVFEKVVGVSLLAPCDFRFRRKAGARWERVTVAAQPRSAYLLAGPARTEWEHSIPAAGGLRYSVTFRSLRSP